MSSQAEVSSIPVLRDWKASLATFHGSATEALVAVELAIRRALDWLDERHKFWQQEVRRREDELVVAKSELWRKQNMPIIAHPDTSQEEKAVRRARQRLEEAEDKLAKTKQWGPALRRAVDEYEGPGRRLAHTLEGDLPRFLALVENKLAALEAYLALVSAPPTSSTQG